jgi:peroxiredoxin
LDQAREEVRRLGGGIVAVFQYRAEPTRSFCRRRGVDLDCLGDPEREGYRAVGLERGSVMAWAGPQMAKRTVEAIASGHGMKPAKGGDVTQLPGTFVVGADGRVAFAHYNRDAADNPENEAVIAALRDAAKPA